jgi:hypothetical protein
MHTEEQIWYIIQVGMQYSPQAVELELMSPCLTKEHKRLNCLQTFSVENLHADPTNTKGRSFFFCPIQDINSELWLLHIRLYFPYKMPMSWIIAIRKSPKYVFSLLTTYFFNYNIAKLYAKNHLASFIKYYGLL